jgi:hypothetical protein
MPQLPTKFFSELPYYSSKVDMYDRERGLILIGYCLGVGMALIGLAVAWALKVLGGI